jgi:hypothetical protein
MKKNNKLIVLTFLFSLITIQAFRLYNIDYNYFVKDCESGKEFKFRILDSTTVSPYKPAITFGSLYFLYDAYSNHYFYIIEVNESHNSHSSNKNLMYVYSRIDLTNKNSLKFNYCFIPTSDLDLLKTQHYHELVIR